MTGDETPESPLDDERKRHGRTNAHVPKILEMYWRDTAKRQLAHVQWQTGKRIHIRVKRGRLILRVGNDAEPVLKVKFAGLAGNVGGGIP
jgi:hypothetical protein